MEQSNDTILTYPYKDYTWRSQKMSFLAGLEVRDCLLHNNTEFELSYVQRSKMSTHEEELMAL